MRLLSRLLEGLIVVFVGTFFGVLLQHDLLVACPVGVIVCVAGLYAIGRIERSRNSKAPAPTASLRVPEGASVSGVAGTSAIVEFVNKAKGPVGDAVRSSFDFAPDFSGDWAKRDRLLERCAGAVEEPEAVSAWINGVYNKLLAWKPKRALEFRPDPPSSTMRIPGPGASAAGSLLKDFKTEINHSRKSLTEYGQRLADILYEEGKL